jgi:hypothetical protein
MNSVVIPAPLDLMEDVAALRFPANADRHLQSLMDRNTEGTLTTEEREELAALAELSERMALVRARALRALGRTPA